MFIFKIVKYWLILFLYIKNIDDFFFIMYVIFVFNGEFEFLNELFYYFFVFCYYGFVERGEVCLVCC